MASLYGDPVPSRPKSSCRTRMTNAAEVWHFLANTPLKPRTALSEGEAAKTLLLSIDIAKGGGSQGVVPANCLRRSRTMYAWDIGGLRRFHPASSSSPSRWLHRAGNLMRPGG